VAAEDRVMSKGATADDNGANSYFTSLIRRPSGVSH